MNVYYPQEKSNLIHQQRVTPPPLEFPSGYYWYGSKRQWMGSRNSEMAVKQVVEGTEADGNKPNDAGEEPGLGEGTSSTEQDPK